MLRIYTEIRISHKSQEEKAEFEKGMDELVKKRRYKDRADWIYRLVQNYIIENMASEYREHQHNYKIGDKFKNLCTNETYEVIRADSNVIVGQNSKEQRAFGECLTYGFEDLVKVEGEK